MSGESVAALQQISTVFGLLSAATTDGDGTTATTDGYNGAQMVEVKKTGSGTTTLTLYGSFDKTTWYAVGYYQVDATASLARAASGISIGGGTVNHVYQILDLYPYLKGTLSSTSGSLSVTARVYCVGV